MGAESLIVAQPCACVVLLCFYLVVWSCADLDPPHGVSYFPFYRPRESAGYSGGKGEERERRRLPGLSDPSSPSCGSCQSCRCQQGQLHIMALSVTSAMRRHHLPVMAFHPVPTDVVVN